jgi:hypothetical protein
MAASRKEGRPGRLDIAAADEDLYFAQDVNFWLQADTIYQLASESQQHTPYWLLDVDPVRRCYLVTVLATVNSQTLVKLSSRSERLGVRPLIIFVFHNN